MTMSPAWGFGLLVAMANIHIICTQIKQSGSWEDGWVAINGKPQQQSNYGFDNIRSESNGKDDINGIITKVLESKQKGRSLEEYDTICDGDCNIEEALQQGNNVEARNLVRDKLCFLGLSSCDVPEKPRPNYAINTNTGRLPATQYLNYNGGYRVPPPLPPQKHLNNFGPLRNPGPSQYYNPNFRPFENAHGPRPTNSAFYTNRPSSQIFQQYNGGVSLPQNNIYHKQPATASSNNILSHVAAVPSKPQQQIHHHYHHVEGTSDRVQMIPSIHGSFGQHSSLASLPNIGGIHASIGTNNYRPGLNGAGIHSVGYNPTHGQVSGSFHTQQNPVYQKKDLHKIGGITASSNGFHSQQPNGHIIERQQILNCFCVPFNQCPVADRIGRKEDLILPLDPRNLGKQIESLRDISISNSTRSNSQLKRTTREALGVAGIKTTLTATHATEENEESSLSIDAEGRAYYGNRRQENSCRPHETCCRRPSRPAYQQEVGRCGINNWSSTIGRIKTPNYSNITEYAEYPWQVVILKKDPNESIYACGGTLIDAVHVITAAHCIKAQQGFDLRARMGEWDINHDVELYPYVEREIVSVQIHPQYYAGTLENDLALLKLDQPIDFQNNPHISPACLPDKYADFTGERCWTTGWGKDAFEDNGKYQNILKEVDLPILSHQQCESQLRRTRLGNNYKLSPGFLCAGGETGKDSCKGDGGGPLVCKRYGIWNVVGVVSWGIGCGLPNVPGVYVRVAHYIDWIRQLTQQYR